MSALRVRRSNYALPRLQFLFHNLFMVHHGQGQPSFLILPPVVEEQQTPETDFKDESDPSFFPKRMDEVRDVAVTYLQVRFGYIFISPTNRTH